MVGLALNFDGSDDYVSLPSHDFINEANDFSYSVWIRPSIDITSGMAGGFETKEFQIISLHDGPYLYFALETGELKSDVKIVGD